MTNTKYEMASAYLERIRHIDELLAWLMERRNNNQKIMFAETDRTSGPHHICCKSADYNVFILALEKDKKDCEESFAKL